MNDSQHDGFFAAPEARSKNEDNELQRNDGETTIAANSDRQISERISISTAEMDSPLTSKHG